MKITRIPFDQVKQFSSRDIAYQNESSELKPFYKYKVDVSSFEHVIEAKKSHPINRSILVDGLMSQYQGIPDFENVHQNIELLKKDNTFTIVTAHQPSLLTGPLYYIYKICSTIHLCKTLKEAYPNYQFVPTFVSGGEDHDFEEINHLNIYNKTITWLTTHTNQPTGRMPINGLDHVLKKLRTILRNDSDAQKLIDNCSEFEKSSSNYGSFMFKLVHHLFGKFGLVFINMDQSFYKKAFTPLIKQEIIGSKSKQYVRAEQEKLSTAGFKPQAFVRDINFFYITEEGSRKRIEKSDDKYKIVDSTLSFSEQEMIDLIEQYPERFSPNVIMRPIYQEFILPNLAYIGGGGELAYWMERITQFDAFQIPFPMLIRRNSVLILDHGTQRNMQKTGFQLADAFEDQHIVVNQFLKNQAGDQFSLEEYANKLSDIFLQISERTRHIDQTLVGKVEAEKTKLLKSIDQIEARLKKHTKQKSESEINRISKIFESIRPENSLQERKTNILEFLDKYDRSLIDNLVSLLNPLEKEFIVIRME